MYDEFTLSAAQRNYRKPGAKLKPRFAPDAAERDWKKLHSMRELRKEQAIECKAMTEYYEKREGFDTRIDPHWRKFYKAMDALGARSRKRVERALEASADGSALVFKYTGRAMVRATLAAIEAHGIDLCIEADQKMLANAY